MALISSGTHSSRPGMYYEFYADQVGGSGNDRTVTLTLKLKCGGSSSASFYGYPVNWRGYVNGSWSGWASVKGSERWYGNDGLRTYSWSYTTNVNTTNSVSISVGFQTDAYSGASDWDFTNYGNFTVGSTNTSPTMKGEVTIRSGDSNGQILSGIVPENISTLYLSWEAGSDNEQGANGLKYGVNEIIDSGGSTTILYPTQSLFHTVEIGVGNEGQRRSYFVDCRDNNDALSTNRASSATITKNTLTGDSINSLSRIEYETTDVEFMYSGASNTNGSKIFSRTLSCSEVAVYNQDVSTSPFKVVIYKGGEKPKEPYILFEDLKAVFSKSQYKGNMTFTLVTKNEYGSSRSSTKSIPIDIRTNPEPAKNVIISMDLAESSMCKKVLFSDDKYLIPNGVGSVMVKWEHGVGKLGELISYELFFSYGEKDDWVKITDIQPNIDRYSHVIPKQTEGKNIKYLVRTKTEYGFYSDAISGIETLHFYNNPNISIGNIIRSESLAEVKATLSLNTSIKNGVIVGGKWENLTRGTNSPVLESGLLETITTEQVITVPSLKGNGQYDLKIVYSDNTGFSEPLIEKVSIGQNLPVLFINKYGVGVGGKKAEEGESLVCLGRCNVVGDLYADNIFSNSNEVLHKGNLPTAEEIGARPSWWVPTAKEAGAISNLSLNNNPIYDLEFEGTDFKFMDSKTPGKPSNVVTASLLQQTYDNDKWKNQMIHDWRNNDIYIRSKNNGNWTAWEKLQKAPATKVINSVDQESIINENIELKKKILELENRILKIEERLNLSN